MKRLSKPVFILVMLWLLLTAVMFVRHAERIPRSAAGVVLDLGGSMEPLPVGGLAPEEVASAVRQVAGQLHRDPIEPVIEPVTRGVIPGLAGQEFDLEATVANIMAAHANDRVEPVLYAVEPKSLWEFATYPIYQGNPAKRQISLVINVAWGNDNLPEMLDILAESNVKASFFLVGRWAANNPELVQRIAAAGHEFGNRAYSDPHLPQLSRDDIASEITRTSEVIERLTGQKVRFFSPPYNDFNQTVLDTAADLGYLTVLCSLDTADWMRPGVERIVQRIVPKAHSGAIVLMHPTEQTPAALRQIINGLQGKGYQLVTVGELLASSSGELALGDQE